MTALVGVLNKSGVAIAADSAITVFGNGRSKIYDKEQKIFRLSEKNPVGVMICSNLNFLNTPFSLIFDLYRSERGNVNLGSLSDYVNDFLSYLESLKQLQDRDVKNLYYQREFEALLTLFKSIYDENYDQLKEENPGMKEENISRECYKNTFDDITNLIFEQEIHPQLKNFSKDDFLKEFVGPNNDWLTNYREMFPRMTNQEWDTLLGYFLRDLINNTFGLSQGSELIFVGYGADDIFPASQRVFLSGMVGDIIKYEIEEISRITHINDAEIRPFAQTDVMLTLIKGISPKLDEEYREATSELEQNVTAEIISILQNQRVPNNVITNVINVSYEKIKEAFDERIESFIHENYIEGVLDAVRFFNLEEMAKMAENLIAVTNLQRHISSSEESVGGPIEVAVLTKTGGFKWLKHNNIH